MGETDKIAYLHAAQRKLRRNLLDGRLLEKSPNGKGLIGRQSFHAREKTALPLLSRGGFFGRSFAGNGDALALCVQADLADNAIDLGCGDTRHMCAQPTRAVVPRDIGVSATNASHASASLVDSSRCLFLTASQHRALDARFREGSKGGAFVGIELPSGLEQADLGNHCADSEYPGPFEDFANTGIYADRGSAFGPAWWWYNAGCADWPLSEDRHAGPWTAETSAPVLVVGNYFDGVTDYAGAVASAELLPNSRLLSYAGWGHTAFGANTCTTDHIVSYLLDGTLPAEGTVCAANPNPFLPLPALEAEAPAVELASAAASWHHAVRPRPSSRRLGR